MYFSTRISFLFCLQLVAVHAFVISSGPQRTTSDLNAPLSRRDILGGAAAAFLGAVVTSPTPAEATYSAYTAREKDWEERISKGDIKVSSARSLRQQLKEIVPENDDAKSKVFCPNGASAAVSPLMENKCSDVLMAMPSVYGRTSDTVGNSIPGFSGGLYSAQPSSSLSANPSVGGFPKY